MRVTGSRTLGDAARVFSSASVGREGYPVFQARADENRRVLRAIARNPGLDRLELRARLEREGIDWGRLMAAIDALIREGLIEFSEGFSWEPTELGWLFVSSVPPAV